MGKREIPRMQIGTVAALWRYPVKALAAEPLARATVEAGGFAGDRASALIVRSTGHARSGKPLRGKEHHLLHTVATPQAARAIASRAGIDIEARTDAEHYFDARPISLVFDSWLGDVEALVGYALDPLRYRPNIFARAAADFSGREDALVGALLLLGDTALRVVEPIRRCVTTTYDVGSGESDPAVLQTVARHRSNVVGVYCVVERPGTIAPDDPIVR